VTRRLGAMGLAAAILVSGGCPESGYNPLRPEDTGRWDFDMGNRGGGTIQFKADGLLNGPQAGECLTPLCHTRVENRALLELTPIASSGFQFKAWEGDPAHGLACDGISPLDHVLRVTVIRNGGCFAVFEATGPGTPTTPGILPHSPSRLNGFRENATSTATSK
jgi:hypothetical protein